MTFAIYESIKMNTTSVQLQSPDYHVIQVIPEAPDGTTREGAIHHLAAAGYYLQYGQEIRDEPECR